jgi:AcrR family transcriptional regulator
MARPRPPHILEDILRAGEAAVIDAGYASVSVAAIARGAGIGVGSIYHYFADKDALLDWVVVRVLRPDIELPSDLPLGAPSVSISEAVAPYLNVHVALPYLHEVSAREVQGAMLDELRAVIGEFCELVVRTDRVQTMVEVCSNDLEELRRAWYLDYRRALAGAYESYFRRRVAEGAMRPIGDPKFAARWLLDSAILFIRLRRLDYYPDELPTANLTERLVDMLLLGFAGDPA